MLQSMMHENFYRAGQQAHAALKLWVGWVCHQGSFSDCLPIWNERRDICLIFSGETYADNVEVQRLLRTGHDYNPNNASYLVHLYEEVGIKFLEKLNGWFSGILIDLREQHVVLFNDRFGLDRVYYHETKQGLYFSSEAKALLKILPPLRQLDPQGMGEFFSCGSVLQDRTLFSGVSLLPPGSAWWFAPGKPARKRNYFRREHWEEQAPLSSAEYEERLKEIWARVLPRYFQGEERVGLSLTGGVDSRMILAWAPSASGALPCYTFGGKYRECMDVKVARKIAAVCRQPHQVIEVSDEFLRGFPALAEKSVYLSDGSMDVTGAIDVYVQRKARQIAPVRITGTNGGEILRRLVAFKPTPFNPDILTPEMAGHVRAAAATYAGELSGHRLSFTAFKQTPWYMCSKFALERSQLTLRMPFFDNELVALSYQTPPELIDSNEPALHLIADRAPALRQIETDRGLTGRALPGITRARHLYQQFTFKAEYAYDYGMPPWLAAIDHRLGRLHLEKLFLGRHKFHHFRVYYRDHFASFIRDLLLDTQARSRPYLVGTQLERIVNGHLSGAENHTLAIHKLLTSELIHRQLLAIQ